MQTIKDFLSKYKIHVAVVGGALVIGTAYATCTVEPVLSEPADEAVEEAAPEAETEEAAETTSSAPATESSNSEGNSSTENN